MSAIPRLVVSAPASGHGKTAITVGLLAALTARGLRTAGFKIGSDYVDAAYLGHAASMPGRNLDPRLVGSDQIGPLFVHGASGAEVAVVEGTMGLYDGLAGRTDAESTAQLAGALRAPVVLVIDVAAMGQSVAALVHGFRAFDELVWFGGVILNRVSSDRHEQVLREALGDLGVPVLGVLRRRVLAEAAGPHGAPLPPRYDGVGPVSRDSLAASRAVRRLGELISRNVHLDRVLALARSAPRLSVDPWSPATALGEPAPGRRPLIAVAGGPRLTFGYAETIDLLRAAGAEIAILDPVRDQALPEHTDGLIIGGALPESYAEDLSANERLRGAVAEFARTGRPISAEGAGVLWLCENFAGRPMCGVIPARAGLRELTVLGYRKATAASDSVLMSQGTQVVGHKLHRTVAVPRSGQRAAWSWAGSPPEGFVWPGGHASYLCLHWAGLPILATRFVEAARAIAPARGPAPGPAPAAASQPAAAPAAAVQVPPVLAPPVAEPPLAEPSGGPTVPTVPVTARPTVPTSALPVVPAPALPTVPAPALPVVPAPALPTVPPTAEPKERAPEEREPGPAGPAT